MLRSYQNFEGFRSVISALTGNQLKEQIPVKSTENILGFIKKYSRVAPIEIETAFDLSKSELDTILEDLNNKGLIRLIPAGNGLFIETVSKSLECNPTTDQCNI